MDYDDESSFPPLNFDKKYPNGNMDEQTYYLR